MLPLFDECGKEEDENLNQLLRETGKKLQEIVRENDKITPKFDELETLYFEIWEFFDEEAFAAKRCHRNSYPLPDLASHPDHLGGQRFSSGNTLAPRVGGRQGEK